MKLLPQALAAVLILTVCAAGAGHASPPPNARTYEEHVRPVLARYCFACHAAAKAKGNLRLDRLSSRISDEADREHWLSIRQRLQAREMPPKGRPRPRENEVQALVEWINEKIEAAEAGRRKIALRRLNRVEYENTVRELLGVDIELKEHLPLDTPAFGFDNNAEAMHVSSFLMEKYLEAADLALDAAIASGPKPRTIKQRYTLKDQHQVKHASERVFRCLDDTVVLFSSSPWQAVTLYQLYPPDRGRYRFRISVSGFQSGGKPVTFRVDAGPMLMGTKNHLISYFDAPADKPTIVEFIDYLEARSTIRILPYGLAPAQAVDKVGADQYTGSGLAVQWVEVEGPLNDTWPPASHRRLFGDLPQASVPRPSSSHRVEVVSKDPKVDARRLLRIFARRAFRRAVSDDDIKPFVQLVQTKMADNYSFEQAVRVGLLGVMVSPEFLFFREKPGQLDDFALASRLSYFLWSTMPDEELLTLAEQRKVAQPATLRRQVERLLNDPKAAAFTENFVGQWLGLRDIDFTEPSHILYPEFDDMLKVSMVREAELFFRQVLREDLSLESFVASDFAMLNGRLAKHYGIAGIEGWELRKVKLPPESHRGGVLTMAGVLKVTANGTTTSPVVRGAWVLDRILGTPPPKPPADIPAIEPDIRGATTIRQQLAKHRQAASCASCHAKIDPPGFALESFDVIGGWREHYRTSGRGAEVLIEGRRMPYLQGPKVDPADVMADGERFANIDELKQLLLKDRDQLARALTEKLLTYATGAAPTPTDRAEIEDIVRKVRTKNYGLRTLIHEIVQSKAFQQK
jgi:mono/diheme cytochrome c family protein